MNWTMRALFLLDHLDLEQATGVPGAKWEMFQLAHLCDDNMFRIEVKSRQIAFSWLVAAEAVAEAILDKRDTIFVSINLNEAKEKIRYSRAVIEALRPDVRPRLRRDNEMGIELPNGARINSLPARAPRGRARSNVVLDEFAHTVRDRDIYTAALPVISKGGRLRIGSSPLGASGMFWEVYTQKIHKFPGYKRRATPWWHVVSMCREELLEQALVEAPGMPTEERVKKFGAGRILTIYSNMIEQDFQQEFETAFQDESDAWLSWEEIKAVTDPDMAYAKATVRGELMAPALDAIAEIERMMRKGEIAERSFGLGMDIGRTRDATEIFLIGIAPKHPLRLLVSMESSPFDVQEAVLSTIMESLPISAAYIDRTGLGRQLAERAEKNWPSKAIGQDFTNETKRQWATDVKMLFQRLEVKLPSERDLTYQMHSVKRLVTSGKLLSFDVDKSERHHADKFWAYALALAAAIVPPRTLKIGFM